MLVEIREVAKVRLKNPVIIEGFPGVGMIGTISSSFLADKLKMKLVGYIQSSHFPPIAAIHDFVPMSPARIYASEEHNLIILFSEFMIPAEVVYALSQRIIKYAKDKNASEIYSLAGIASQTPDSKVYGICSTKKMADKLRKFDIELVREGATQGVSGILIAECASEGIPAANLLVQVDLPMAPQRAAMLLNKVKAVVGLDVDVKQLEAEGKAIQEKIADNMSKIKAMHTDYDEMQNNPAYS
ncbi:MAG: PAC2 family protein [Candidatus Micrarchaeota archaeon]